MPEIADVVLSEEIEVEWGNDIRDRTVQRYADLAERTSEHSSPAVGDLSFLEDSGDLDVYFSGSWRHLGAQVGTMQMHAGGSTPTGWLLCNGQAVSRTTYAALFAQIGTIWGVGDGSTTFNVPDMRGRVPRGVAASGTGDAVGETFGADTHTHTGPSHTHTGPSHTHTVSGTTTIPTGTLVNRWPSVADGFPPNLPTTGHNHDFSDTSSAAGTGATGASGTGNTGSSSTIQAGAAVNFIIKT